MPLDIEVGFVAFDRDSSDRDRVFGGSIAETPIGRRQAATPIFRCHHESVDISHEGGPWPTANLLVSLRGGGIYRNLMSVLKLSSTLSVTEFHTVPLVVTVIFGGLGRPSNIRQSRSCSSARNLSPPFEFGQLYVRNHWLDVVEELVAISRQQRFLAVDFPCTRLEPAVPNLRQTVSPDSSEWVHVAGAARNDRT